MCWTERGEGLRWRRGKLGKEDKEAKRRIGVWLWDGFFGELTLRLPKKARNNENNQNSENGKINKNSKINNSKKNDK